MSETTPAPAFCANCGTALREGASFCTACGYNVAPPSPAPATQETAGEAPVRAQPQYSADGKWWWNGTQWMAVAPVRPVAQAMPTEAAPAVLAVKRKRGAKRLRAPLLILAGAFALGWFFWPYELLIAVAGIVLAALAWWNPSGIGTRIKAMAGKLHLPGMKPSRSGKAAASLLVLSLVLFPTGAGALGQFVGAQVANLPQQVSLSGVAYMGHPLTAYVTVYEMGSFLSQLYPAGSSERKGTVLGTATSGNDGSWTVNISRRPQSSLLIETDGGVYVDEISKKPVAGGTLSTVLFPTLSYAQLTPLTTIASARTLQMIGNGMQSKTAWDVAYFTVARQYNLDVDTMVGLTPTMSDDPQDVLATTRDARQEGLILAGLDQEATTLGTSEAALTTAIASDLSDGKLDGKQGATPILLDHGAALSPDAATKDLQKGIDKVAPSPGFDNHIPAPQVLLQPINIGLNGAGLFPATTALPAFVNTRGASVVLEGRDGTKPYYCEPVSGLPDGFSMSNSCVLRYDGTEILGANGGTSVLKFLPAFNVTMTDASSPKQSVTFSLTITVTQQPPQVTGLAGNCPQATVQCTLTIASVKGGTPPYSYTMSANGLYPLGMFINLFKPILSGQPAKAGTYNLTVCATDLVGNQGCGSASLVVGEGPSPSPQASATDNNPPPTGQWYVHYSCEGDPSCAFGANTGIRQGPYSTKAECDYSSGADKNFVAAVWCSQSSNPADTGP